MGHFHVAPDKEEQLLARMAALGVREEDLVESFVRSGGHGGQNVNKTSTCVMLAHRPSGIRVKCQDSRQQGLNRFLARNLLLDKIEAVRQRAREEQKALAEKLRRQRRPRGRAAKERMLADKSRHSVKKQHRKSGAWD